MLLNSMTEQNMLKLISQIIVFYDENIHDIPKGLQWRAQYDESTHQIHSAGIH